MRFVAICISLLCASCAIAQESKNNHEFLVKELESQGHIVIDSSSFKPVELQYESVGRFIICMQADSPTVALHQLDARMFKAGTFSVRISCVEGKLFISQGYL